MGLRHRQVLWVLSCARSTLADVVVVVHQGLRLSIVGYLIPVCYLTFVGSGGGFKATFVWGFRVLVVRITA